MTARYGWCGDPCNLWRFFDEFGMDGLKMELDATFLIELPTTICVTRYTNSKNKCCYALASWADTPITLDLEVAGCRGKE